MLLGILVIAVICGTLFGLIAGIMYAIGWTEHLVTPSSWWRYVPESYDYVMAGYFTIVGASLLLFAGFLGTIIMGDG